MPSMTSDLTPPNPPPTKTTTSQSIPPSAMPLISPSALIRTYLTQQPPIRPSGRTPLQSQTISLNTSSLTHCNGSAVLKLGTTTVVCGIRAEIIPVSDIPSFNPKNWNLDGHVAQTSNRNEKYIKNGQEKEVIHRDPYDPISLYHLIVPNLELSTGCSPLHTANAAPSSQAQSLTQRLYSLLLTSGIVSSQDLEIVYIPPVENETGIEVDDVAYVESKPELKAYWVLYVDVMCLSYGGEGGVFDASWLAIQAALADVVLPKAWWDGDEAAVFCSSAVEEGRKLQIRASSVPVSFGVFEVEDRGEGLLAGGGQVQAQGNESWLLIDLDVMEEECCGEKGTVVVDFSQGTDGKIVRLEKSGGVIVGVKEVKQILEIARQRWHQWMSLLNDEAAIKTTGA